MAEGRPRQEAHQEAEGHADRRGDHELPDGLPRREGARHGGDDGGAIQHQCGGVVDQALPFEDRHDAMRDAKPPGDGRGRDRVGRGDDGAEDERRGPAEARHECVRHGGDGGRRGQHQPDREERDGPEVRLEVAERGEVRRRPENGRQEDQEDDVGTEPHGRDAGHDAEEQPSEHQEDRVRHEDAARDGHEDQHGAHQQDHRLDAMQRLHGPPLWTGPR